MFGEAHESTAQKYFDDQVLPALIQRGYRNLVLENLPSDFHAEAWAAERSTLYRTGKVTKLATPKLYEHLEYTKGENTSTQIETAVKNNLFLFGCGLNASQLADFLKDQSEQRSVDAARNIQANLRTIISALPINEKTIFYNGDLHNNYPDQYDVGVRADVDKKYGKDNVLSIDLVDMRKISKVEPNTAKVLEDKITKAKPPAFPAIIHSNDIEADFMLVLNNDYVQSPREIKLSLLKQLGLEYSQAKDNGAFELADKIGAQFQSLFNELFVKAITIEMPDKSPLRLGSGWFIDGITAKTGDYISLAPQAANTNDPEMSKLPHDRKYLVLKTEIVALPDEANESEGDEKQKESSVVRIQKPDGSTMVLVVAGFQMAKQRRLVIM